MVTFLKAIGVIVGAILLVAFASSLIGNNSPTPTPPDPLKHAEDQIAAATQDPHKVALMECMGVKVYEDPQPAGHPPSAAECAAIEHSAGLPATPDAAPATAPDVVAPADDLTTLISHCDANSGLPCTEDLYQKVWRKIEADNGEVTKIDMRSIQRFNTGAVDVAIYTYVPNTLFDPSKLRRLTFDCAGHFMDSTGGFSEQMDAPPQSIAGQIASIVCAR